MTDPNELLELLSKDADPRKVKSLRVIHDICEDQRARGSMDFSVATIGRLSSEKGGPAGGAIRNATGEAYRAIIKAHLDAAGGKKPKGRPHKADENPFEGITDPVLRARIGMLLAENESLKGQLHAARHLTNKEKVVDLRRHVPATPSTIAKNPMLSKQEIEALWHAFSEINLEKQGWHVSESGRITGEDGQSIFKLGLLSAVSKILEVQ